MEVGANSSAALRGRAICAEAWGAFWDLRHQAGTNQRTEQAGPLQVQHQVIVSLAAGLVVCVLAESWALPLHWSHVKYSWWGWSAAGGPYPVSLQDDSEV